MEDFVYNPDELKENPYSELFLAGMQKWLREEKDLVVCVGHEGKYYWYINELDGTIIDGDVESILYKTYGEALSVGINRALELLKEVNK